MKAGWKTVKLGEACKIVNGATPSTSVEANWGGPHCWITPAEMGGLSDPYVSETRRTLTDVGLADCSASLLPEGSVILSSRAPIGHVIINMVPMATNQGCKSMIPRSDLDAKFLFYFIKANVPLLESLGTGATFKELSGGKLASVEIPLPPLAEQKRIVALLDEAFAGIDVAKAKIDECSESVTSILQVFVDENFDHFSRTCPARPLKEVSEYFNGLTYAPPDVSDTGTVVLRSSNVQEGKLDLSDRVRVSARIKEKLYVRTGDVLMCSRNGSKRLIGKCTLIPADLPERMTFGTFMMIIRSEIGPFLDLFFNSSRFKTQMASGSATNINQITRGMLDSVELPIADSAESAAFVGKATELSALLNEYEARLSHRSRLLQEMKSSLLTQAFAGELTA